MSQPEHGGATPTDHPVPAEVVTTELIDFVGHEIAGGAEVEPGTDLVMSGLVDSLGVVRIVAWLEDRLQLRIDPGDVVLEHFETVEAIIGYLRERGGVA